MKVNKATLDLIKRWESFVDHVYICAAGYRTVGFGHLVAKGEEFSTISLEEAEELLQKDLTKAINAVNRLITVPLNENQFGALVSFTFNCGNGALQRSTLRSKLNRGEYNEVPTELLKWCHAGGRKLKGLLNRRIAESSLFQS
jgi:lysozyme